MLPMDKLIYDRKKQLNDMKHMLKMQDLLEEYDRQNTYLNKQVDTLLKQNIKLKQQSSFTSISGSRVNQTHDYNSRDTRNSFMQNQHNKSTSSNYKSRKSRYQYMFDEKEIKDLKSNLKNQIKRDAIKTLSSKEVQANLDEINIRIPTVNKETKIIVDKSQQASSFNKSNESMKFTPVKRVSAQMATLYHTQSFNNKSRSGSKSKSKSKQRLEISLKSRLYEEPKHISSTEPRTLSPKKQLKQKTEPQIFPTVIKQQQIVLEHSFGQSSQQRLQKKFTLLESDLNLVTKEQKQISQSRMTDKFLPLSIQSKQLSKQISTNMPKTQFQSTNYQYSFTYNQPASRTESKSKRNHSLNPSPKVDYLHSQVISQKIKPFVLKTEQSIQAPSGQLHRNPSQQIKRKFIKIVSSQKIYAQQSPKKR